MSQDIPEGWTLWPTLQAGKEFRRKEGLATVQVRVWSVASLKMWDSTGIKGWKGWACERRGTFHLKGYEERHIVEWKQQRWHWLILNKVSFNTYSAEHMFCPYRDPRLLHSRNFHLARIRKAHDDPSQPRVGCSIKELEKTLRDMRGVYMPFVYNSSCRNLCVHLHIYTHIYEEQFMLSECLHIHPHKYLVKCA